MTDLSPQPRTHDPPGRLGDEPQCLIVVVERSLHHRAADLLVAGTRHTSPQRLEVRDARRLRGGDGPLRRCHRFVEGAATHGDLRLEHGALCL